MVESIPGKILKGYVDNLAAHKYEEAYDKLHPAFKEKVSYAEYLKNAEKSRKENGDILAVKIEDKVQILNANDYVYSITIVGEKKLVKYQVGMLKENGKWFVNAIKPIAYKLRSSK